MSEENKEWTDNIIDKSDNLLDEFEGTVGVPVNILPGSPDEFKRYLSMDITSLEKLDQKDCANIGYRLIQFSLYIQRSLNREKGKTKILTKKINSIIAPNMSNYNSRSGWDLQRAAAIEDNDAAKSLSSAITESEARQERLEFVATGIKNLADQMNKIQFSKRENNG